MNCKFIKKRATNLQLIDLSKFIMALAVVAIHCDVSSLDSLFCRYFTFVVPLFFVFSGYLMFMKYEEKGVDYILTFTKKILLMWCLWTLIYLPLTILEHIKIGSGIMSSISTIIQSTIFEGKNLMSPHMWYLHSLIVYSFLIWILLKRGFSVELITGIGFFLAFTGYKFSHIIMHDDNSTTFKIVKLYYHIFITNRLLHSLFYISIGLIIKKYQTRLRPYKLLFGIIGVFLPLIVLHTFPFFSYIVTFLLAIFLLNTNIAIKLPYKWFRYMSTAIYFLHMYIIALIQYGLNSITETNFTLRFIIVSTLTFVVATILVNFSTKSALLKHLFG